MMILSMLAITALAIARLNDLFAVVMLFGIYGLLSASLFVNMHAPDVALTEAAVGAGIAPLLMLITLSIIGRYEKPRPRAWFALVLVVITGVLLFVSTFAMPPFGWAEAPAHTHVSARYIQQSGEEIAIPNVVASVLASYRGFDTLGEVVVVFVAGIAVIALLGITRREQPLEPPRIIRQMHQHKVLRIVSKILIPPIMLYGLYVQFHGEYGPGGGFQAGVIFAAAIILYSMLFGVDTAKKVIDQGVVRLLAALGLLLYACTGVLSFFAGENYLNYNPLGAYPQAGQHLGILLIEIGVGVTVATVMILLFFTFADRLSKDAKQ